MHSNKKGKRASLNEFSYSALSRCIIGKHIISFPTRLHILYTFFSLPDRQEFSQFTPPIHRLGIRSYICLKGVQSNKKKIKST